MWCGHLQGSFEVGGGVAIAAQCRFGGLTVGGVLQSRRRT